MEPIDPISSALPVTPAFRVTRERNERDRDEHRPPPRHDGPDVPETEEESGDSGHVDVTA